MKMIKSTAIDLFSHGNFVRSFKNEKELDSWMKEHCENKSAYELNQMKYSTIKSKYLTFKS